MPRRLLRDGRIVDDDWLYAAEAPAGYSGPLILTFDQWQQEREQYLVHHQRRIGVLLSPAHRVDQLIADLPRLGLIGTEFTGPSEGRGYSQARLLREHWHFSAELRATGFVRRDQLFFMARCGFNSFELPDGDIAHAPAAMSTFSAAYQPSNDAGLNARLPRRLRDRPASA